MGKRKEKEARENYISDNLHLRKLKFKNNLTFPNNFKRAYDFLTNAHMLLIKFVYSSTVQQNFL